MRLDSGALVMLDTSVLVRLARKDEAGRDLDARYSLSARREWPLISSVTQGEIGGLVRCWGWGERNLTVLQGLLDGFVVVSAGESAVIEEYSLLYHEAVRGGYPRGENDLWIAATAKAAGAVLLTTDRDFDWMSPRWLSVERYALDG